MQVVQTTPNVSCGPVNGKYRYRISVILAPNIGKIIGSSENIGPSVEQPQGVPGCARAYARTIMARKVPDVYASNNMADLN